MAWMKFVGAGVGVLIDHGSNLQTTNYTNHTNNRKKKKAELESLPSPLRII
jgi:hypothetical protein